MLSYMKESAKIFMNCLRGWRYNDKCSIVQRTLL